MIKVNKILAWQSQPKCVTIEPATYIDTEGKVEREPDDDDWGKGAANFGCAKGLY